MNHKERMTKSIFKKEIPDKVPHGDCMIWPQIHDKILGGSTFENAEKVNYLEYWMSENFDNHFFERDLKTRNFLSFDWTHVFPTEHWQIIDRDKDFFIKKDPYGVEWKVTSDSLSMNKSPINNLNDMKNYKTPSLDQFSFKNLERWVNNSDLFTFVQIDSGVFKLYQIIGFDKFMIEVMDNKNELISLNEKLCEFQINLAKEAIKKGADCIWLSDDHCGFDSSFLSPSQMWELDFQFQKKIVDEVHRLGYPCIMHSCGNLNNTIELMISTGIDGIMGIQPTANNDIESYKRKYGKKITFIGNICVSKLMPYGKPWDVDFAVKDLIKKIGFDGGLVVSTCNALLNDQPIENVITMHLAVEKYGHYPVV